MKIEYVANTGFHLEHKGIVFGMDLWLTQGAFEGSWFHYPPLRETKYSVRDCKYIYISHIHPDHCDFAALRAARPDTVFIVPNYFNHLLKRKLNSFGFENVLSMAPGEKKMIGDGIEVTMYRQFINNLFHEAALGNLIDSAIVIKWDGRKILNCNDNYIDEPSAEKLVAEHGTFDLALAPHSASGPYPASFRNLSREKKESEARRLQTQYIDHFVKTVSILKPKMVVPCAAEYAIVGEQYEKNPYIGLAEPKDAVIAFQKSPAAKTTRAVQLDCGTILDVDSGELSGLPVRQLSMADKMAFATELKQVYYPYHWEDNFHSYDITKLFANARATLWDKQQKLKFFKDYNVYLYVDEKPAYGFNFNSPDIIELAGKPVSKKAPYLECFLSRQLFFQILVKKAHWNNAEGGLHIDFYREPNDYVPEVFTLLSFLHVSETNGVS